MSRLDAIGISVAVFALGGIGYLALKLAGVGDINAGVWSQLILVVVVLGWTVSYVFRVGTDKMTYAQQRREYEDAVFQQQLDKLSPEELEALQAEIDRENAEK
jgi:hypothetical protein